MDFFDDLVEELMDYRIALDRQTRPSGDSADTKRLKSALERAIIEANTCARLRRKNGPAAA